MAEAYVRINVEPGSEKAVWNDLKGLENVKEVALVTGREDFIVKIEAATYEALLKEVPEKLRKIPKILRTETSIVANNGF